MDSESKKDLIPYTDAVANLRVRGLDVTHEDMAMWIKFHDRKNPNDHTLAAFTGMRRRYERNDRPGMAPSHAGPPSRASIKADAKKAEQWFDKRFYFSESGPRWQEQIQSAFFYAEEIQNFSPSPGERYITGQDLRKRWAALENSSVCPGTVDEFTRGMIKNDRLWDIHPITGGTKWDDHGTKFGKNRVKDLPSKDPPTVFVVFSQDSVAR